MKITKNTVLRAFDRLVIPAIQATMKSTGRDATGKASKSLRLGVDITPMGFVLQIIGADYFEYIEKGRRPGTPPPFNAILEWVIVKMRLTGKMAERAAWGVRTKIGQEGSPTRNSPAQLNVIKDAIDPILPDIKRKMEQIAGKEIITRLRETTNRR